MKFITLGPAGSNHEFVTRRYLDFHRIAERAAIVLTPDFEQGAAAVLAGEADFLVQCAVHPATMATVARFFDGLYAMDTFIASSRDLAVIQRRDVEHATSLAVMRPTLDYIDAGQWAHIEWVDTVAAVTQGLSDGTYAAGLAYADIASEFPERLKVVQFVGTVDDVWIVYGRVRASDSTLVAWRDSPAACQYRRME